MENPVAAASQASKVIRPSARSARAQPSSKESAMSTEGRSVAELIARFLVARGVDRIFGLQGGHIQPIWDHLHQLGVRIVDVRDEGAAVHMAHAHAVAEPPGRHLHGHRRPRASPTA
jgi:hypothetical protein